MWVAERWSWMWDKGARARMSKSIRNIYSTYAPLRLNEYERYIQKFMHYSTSSSPISMHLIWRRGTSVVWAAKQFSPNTATGWTSKCVWMATKKKCSFCVAVALMLDFDPLLITNMDNCVYTFSLSLSPIFSLSLSLFPSRTQMILVLKSLGLYQNCTRFAILLQIFSHVLAYTTACINPLLYAFLSENFRKAFKKVSMKIVFVCVQAARIPHTYDVRIDHMRALTSHTQAREHTWTWTHLNTLLIAHNLMHVDIFNSF